MLEKMNKLSLKDGIILQEVNGDNKYYALNTENGDCFELTHTAYFILDLIQKTNDIKEVLDGIVDTYGLSAEEAQKDLKEMIKTGSELGILLT